VVIWLGLSLKVKVSFCSANKGFKIFKACCSVKYLYLPNLFSSALVIFPVLAWIWASFW
jgi:hypothetical protein